MSRQCQLYSSVFQLCVITDILNSTVGVLHTNVMSVVRQVKEFKIMSWVYVSSGVCKTKPAA